MNDPQSVRKVGSRLSYKTLKIKIYEGVIQPLVYSRNTPHYDAFGVAVGLVVGLGAPLGSHMLFLGLMRLVQRFNVVVAFGFTFVVNPLNAIPMYYGYYLLGSFVMGKPAVLSFENFRMTMDPVMESEYFWGSIVTFFQLSASILARWLTSAILLAVLFGVLGYAITYLIQRKRLIKKAVKMGLEYKSLVENLKASGRNPELSAQKAGSEYSEKHTQ
ncbi:MAG: DUF2062 domain-containing protein [Desulfomonilaceae bacterium]|jgi:hypothetical protein